MRIVVFVLLVSIFCMCKSKNIVQQDELVSYIIILKEKTTPKTLLKELDLTALETRRSNKDLNQWTVTFDATGDKVKNIKAQLLNRQEVISVFTLEEFEKIELKKNNKGDADTSGKGRLLKGR